jgi:hypothetical protein
MGAFLVAEHVHLALNRWPENEDERVLTSPFDPLDFAKSLRVFLH